MTEQEKQIIEHFVAKKVSKILLKNTFADKINPTDKLSDLTVFGDADIYLIKKDIATKFDLNISQDISDLLVTDLCSLIFSHVCNRPDLTKKFMNVAQKSIKVATPKPQQNEIQISNDKHLLNSHEVFAIILSALSNMMGRRVFPTERIVKLQLEFMQNGGVNFDQALEQELQTAFGVPIKIVTDTVLNPRMGVYSIATQTTQTLVDYDKAIDPKVECAHMNPLWVPLRTSMTFDTVVKILWDSYGIWTSTKTISNIKSYAEYDKYATTLMIKNKVNKIVFNNDESVLRQNLSDTVISAQDAKSITQNIQNVFNVTVDYDISGTKLGKLYKYLYKKTQESEESRYRLFDKTYNELPSIETDADKQLVTRAEVFAGVIRRVNCAISLGRSVQGYTNIQALLNDIRNSPKKQHELEKLFHDLEVENDIKIDITDPQLRIRDICDAIHTSLIRQGKSISTRVALADMDPLWAVLNPAINFDQLKTVLGNEFNINVSVEKLSNRRTYNDYEQLIFAAQLKRAKNQSK